MKKLLSAFCLVTLLFVSSFAQAKMTVFQRIQIGIKVLDLAVNGIYREQPYEKANTIFLKQAPVIFQVERPSLLKLIQAGLSFSDLYSISRIHTHSKVPVLDLWSQHKRGRGWGVIAQNLGMHPGDFNQARVGAHKKNHRIIHPKKKKGKWGKFKAKFKKKNHKKHGHKKHGHNKHRH